MSLYRFTIKDYHAVEKADIRIDGITVLAGANGSGKSTVSRWLYYVLQGMNEYEKCVEIDVMRAAQGLLRKMSRAVSLLNHYNGDHLRRDIYRLTRIRREAMPIESLNEKILLVIDGFVRVLNDYADDRDGPFEITRVQSLIGLEPMAEETFGDYLERVREKLTGDFDAIFEKGRVRLRERSHSSLMSVIGHFSEWDDYRECDIEISEDGVPLISDNEFRLPLSLETAVYYDTQRIGEILSENASSDFARMVREKSEDMPESGTLVKKVLERIMGGIASFDKDSNSIFYDRVLHFRRGDGLVIPLKEAATGVISFSFIYRLLINGWLNRNSLLIIDEPEAHLHPQWIVEFARILVLLNKTIGVKIMMSSHNPDMVAALQSIARKEGMLDSTHFYLAAESESDKTKYIYKDLGQDISEIFQSFNIALSRIDLYGEED